MLWILGLLFCKIGEVKKGAGRQKVRKGAKKGERKEKERKRERNEKRV